MLIHNLLWICRSGCVLLCSAHKGVGVPTESFIVLSMALKRNFFMEYFIVSPRSHDFKPTVLVDIVRRPSMPLYLKEVLVYADTVKYLRFSHRWVFLNWVQCVFLDSFWALSYATSVSRTCSLFVFFLVHSTIWYVSSPSVWYQRKLQIFWHSLKTLVFLLCFVPQ